jgi:hypothetical protein
MDSAGTGTGVGGVHLPDTGTDGHTDDDRSDVEPRLDAVDGRGVAARHISGSGWVPPA